MDRSSLEDLQRECPPDRLGELADLLITRFGAREYPPVTAAENEAIVAALSDLGVPLHFFDIDVEQFEQFDRVFAIRSQYPAAFADEKALEHFVTFSILGQGNWQKGDIFLDIAAAGSLWAPKLNKMLGLQAYALDMAPPPRAYATPPLSDFYIRTDARNTPLPDQSVRGGALHCAYEMFMGHADSEVLAEWRRILRPGGKICIAPLYMRDHACGYSTPQHWGQGYGDENAQEYLRHPPKNVRWSRKYDAQSLNTRVLEPARQAGLLPKVYVCRNLGQTGLNNVYCHFVLVLEAPEEDRAPMNQKPGMDKDQYNIDHMRALNQKVSSARSLNRIIQDLLPVNSVVDVGCGLGAFLATWMEMGATAVHGLDGPWIDQSKLLIPRGAFTTHDMERQLPVPQAPFDLAMCLEVAEHLPASRAEAFVQELTALAPVIAFSAAIPGQGGTGHINEQWPEYWTLLFQNHGYMRLDPFRKRLWNDPGVCWWYAQNTFLFVRPDALKATKALWSAYREGDAFPDNAVHPDCYALARRR